MSNMDVYNAFAEVPANAKKTIGAGRLKGMTDINPMWRIKMLTERYGPCGIGWYYDILEEKTVPGADGEICAFTKIKLYVKENGEWSMGIPGTGGSKLVAKESKGLYTNDECFKMALTDAISIACKPLGMGANVYWESGRTKYDIANDDMKDEAPKDKVDTAQPPLTARQMLFGALSNKGMSEADIVEYAKEHNLTKDTPEATILKLLEELEA